MKKKTRANGTGTAYKRGKTWTVEVVTGFRPDGTRIRATKGGFRTKTEALAYVPQLKERFADPKNRVVTLDSLWKTYIKTGFDKKSLNKQRAYAKARQRLESLAYVDIRKLTISDLQDVVDRETPTYYPAKYVKTVLSRCYDIAIAEQIATNNLAKFLKLPDLNETETTPFNQEEIVALWQAWESGDIICGYALLMIYTGMMPGELCRLSKEMINLDKQIIVGCGIKTNVRKEKPIILPNIIIPVLQRLCSITDCERVCPYEYEEYRLVFREMITRLSLRPVLRPYSCRHTTATTLAKADIPLLDISAIMRHANSQTTQRYVHSSAATLVDKANRAYKN